MMRLLSFILIWLPFSLYAITLKPSAEINASYTTDLFKDGSEQVGAEIISPSITLDSELHKTSGYVIKNTSLVSGQIVPNVDDVNTINASTAFDLAYLMKESQEISHRMQYQYALQNLDKANTGIDSHLISLNNTWKGLSDSDSHSLSVPFSFNYFEDSIQGDGQSPLNSEARENDYRNSHVLSGLGYEYKYFVGRRDYFLVSTSAAYRYYFDRLARATDGGIIPGLEKNLHELRFNGSLSYKADMRRILFEASFGGTFNRDLSFRSDDFWEVSPALSLTWRAHRKLLVRNLYSYSAQKYLNKRSDSLNVVGPHLSNDRVSALLGIESKLYKKLTFYLNGAFEKLISTNKLNEYDAFSGGTGIKLDI